jgi:hypothetical protein
MVVGKDDVKVTCLDDFKLTQNLDQMNAIALIRALDQHVNVYICGNS